MFNQKGFFNIVIAIIVGAVIVLAGTYVIVKRTAFNTTPSITTITNKESLFGTMIAFDAAMGAPGMIVDAIKQKGWTEFRKDDSAYQNLLSNFKKNIQDRTKLVKATGFS